jgi:ribosomal 50S subunit-associated protein YjgA (DUF615 family)
MDELYVSKTARKREALELQGLGQTLAGLKRAQLEALPLPRRCSTTSASPPMRRGAGRCSSSAV